jgi:hypothetical protein
MWKSYELPTSATIDGNGLKIRTDYRTILDIFTALNDPDLTDQEKLFCALDIFYVDLKQISDIEEATRLMWLFINGNKEPEQTNSRKIMDWDQDISIIIPPVNKVLGLDVRGENYLHWWTFLGAYMEIGECTFNTFVSIRSKKAKGKTLESWEKELYRDHKKEIEIQEKLDSATIDLMNEIMGR